LNIKQVNNNLHLAITPSELNLADTLDCGQSFRWSSPKENFFTGIAFGKVLNLTQTKTEIIFHNTSVDEFRLLWEEYFDLNTDYNAIKQELSFEETMRKAIGYAGGIHILKQDSFEALSSFIISQNNNIPRIKNIINKLCYEFGEKIEGENYSFPTAKSLAGLEKSDLKAIGLGYRDEYILDCAKKVDSCELDLQAISKMNIDDARTQLLTIKGVGPKVAECALLFGFYQIKAFPIDTWIKKVLLQYYKDGFPKQAEAYAGIAQQYLFHYIRTGIDDSN